MAPHSSTYAQKIPWMEEPGRLQSMGSQRVRNDCDFTFTFHLQIVSEAQQVKSLAQGNTSYKWQSCDLSSSNTTKAFLSFNPSQHSFWRDNGTPLQYSCLENPMGGGAWQAAVHGVTKSRTQPSDFTLTFHFHALEKEMASHSSVLAWRTPGMEEPGGLPSMGSHRAGHD